MHSDLPETCTMPLPLFSDLVTIGAFRINPLIGTATELLHHVNCDVGQVAAT